MVLVGTSESIRIDPDYSLVAKPGEKLIPEDHSTIDDLRRIIQEEKNAGRRANAALEKLKVRSLIDNLLGI